MPRTLRLTTGTITLDIELKDTPTTNALWEALPIEGRANIWGDEIYFAIPIKAVPEMNARAQVAVGEVAYWPPGSAFCIFFGPTLASEDETPVAASPVNVFGKARGDVTQLRVVGDNDIVKLERVE